MGFWRIAVSVLVVAAIAAGCGGDDEDGGAVSIDQPIGAPPQGSDYPEGSGNANPIDEGPAVVKSASLEVDVAKDELNSAAQAVIDLATAPKIGGFLVSSIVDTNEGYGAGNVLVKVPAVNFEHLVGQLETIGEITRQQLEGQDLGPDLLGTRAALRRARTRTADLLDRLNATDDPAERFQLRGELRSSRQELRALRESETSIEGQTSYASINVHLAGIRPPAGPEKPALERALATARNISLAIVSGAVLAGGVIVPVGILLLILYLVGLPLFRRLKTLG